MASYFGIRDHQERTDFTANAIDRAVFDGLSEGFKFKGEGGRDYTCAIILAGNIPPLPVELGLLRGGYDREKELANRFYDQAIQGNFDTSSLQAEIRWGGSNDFLIVPKNGVRALTIRVNNLSKRPVGYNSVRA